MREFGPPAFGLLGPMPMPVLNGMFDALVPPVLQWHWKHDFVDELSDEAIALHVEHGSKIPTLHSSMHLYPVDGAASRVGEDETAFSYRGAKWSAVYAGVDRRPGQRRPHHELGQRLLGDVASPLGRGRLRQHDDR